LQLQIKRQDFEAAENQGFMCFGPLIMEYKKRVAEGTGNEVKEAFYQHLNEGQRALFMFYTFYNHAIKSVLEFYWWSAYFFAQPKSWSAIKNSSRYFEDEELLEWYEMTENMLIRFCSPKSMEQFDVTRENLMENEEEEMAFKQHYVKYLEITPCSIHKINTHIQQHQEDFILLSE
jgi:hypothetical protein